MLLRAFAGHAAEKGRLGTAAQPEGLEQPSPRLRELETETLGCCDMGSCALKERGRLRTSPQEKREGCFPAHRRPDLFSPPAHIFISIASRVPNLISVNHE